jgi:hypothetical protein
LALENKRVVYNLLFESASQSMLKIAADPRHLGAEIGFISVLHTWGQKLSHHPHLHCIVIGGGLSRDGSQFVASGSEFFLPVRVLSRLFRRLFLEGMKKAYGEQNLEFFGTIESLKEPVAFSALLEMAGESDWVVYAKPPFGGAAQVIEYLSRYTHRVAIANHRLIELKDEMVTFSYKDYRDDYRVKELKLPVNEFISRFLLHILPPGFQRIRHYGLLSNRCKDKLSLCRNLLGVNHSSSSEPEPEPYKDWKSRYEMLTGISLLQCPACKQGRMVTEKLIAPRTRVEISFLDNIDSS